MFFATTVIYVDRQVLGILRLDLKREFGWSHLNYSFIVNSFVLAYAIGYSLVGRMMDAIGERKGFITVFCIWSLASLAHGLIRPLVYDGGPWLNAVLGGALFGTLTPAILSVAGFSVVRFTLGLIEGGHFPGAIKTVGQWHPNRERCFLDRDFQQRQQRRRHRRRLRRALRRRHDEVGLGIRLLSHRHLGLRLGNDLVVALRSSRAAPPRLARGIGPHPQRSPDPPESIPWLQLLRHRQTWAFTLAMLLTSPVWWFYLYWLPLFLKRSMASTSSRCSGRCWRST